MENLENDGGFGMNEEIFPDPGEENIITYSNAIDILLSPLCRNSCGYCGFKKNADAIVVPYSTIKVFKSARRIGAREANFISGERPDSYNTVRAKFDIWGFNSYVEYVYTLAELAFLEGLLVNLNVGYLSLNELKYLQDIVASVEMNMECASPDMANKLPHKFSPSKNPEIRFKFLENSGKLNMPTITGLLVGIGETPEERIELLTRVREIHEEFRHIQLFKITPFVPMPGSLMADVPAADASVILETIRLARQILPVDIDISVQPNLSIDMITLIQHGVSDLGQIRILGKDVVFPENIFETVEHYQQILEAAGYNMYKRLPIKNSFIASQRYSKKLGQFLDKYKARLKENMREDQFVLSF